MTPSNDMLNKNISSETCSGESGYLTPLWLSAGDNYELMAAKIDPHNQIDKIKAVLKLVTLREERVLVQFWSPRLVGTHQLLTSIDQPFGLDVIDEGLLLYRNDCVRNSFVVAKDDEDEDTSPIARVFKLGLPEWSSDLANYLPKHFPKKECAIRRNLHGYLALPVFNLTTGSRVGVIELLTSSKHPSFAYEVQQFQRALKTQNLTCRQVSDGPVSDVPDECSSSSVGRKCKRGSKKMVYVKATYGEDSKGFWFPISSGLSKLKKEVAKRFKLKSQMIRLKYWDEDNDLILFSSNDDFKFAKFASGRKNQINLICYTASCGY